MGTIHKLKPEVRSFIIEEKKNKPTLSCRNLTVLISEQFNIEMSKSSINMVIKEAGLSAPIGRASRKKKRHIAMPVLPMLIESKLEPEIKMIEEAGLKIKVEDEAIAEERLRVEVEEAKVKERSRVEAEAAKKAKEEKLRLEIEESRVREEKIKAEEERLRIEVEEARVKEEKIRIEEEAAKKAEEEKWIKLAEEEKRLKEEAEIRAKKEEARLQEEEKIKLAAALLTGRFPQIEGTGIILLKAADYVIGASQLIIET
ncbi:MAG: hypothetical protein WC394_02455, partial [Candidatus Omnitrophota bacterium]